MPTLGKIAASGAESRYARTQQRLSSEAMTAFRNGIEGMQVTSTQREKLHGSLADWAAARLVEANDKLYRYLAQGQDIKHLKARSAEIEARFTAGALGVLLHRVTLRRPNPSGDFAPEYLGLIVVGEGSDEAQAIYKHQKALRQASAQESPRPGTGVCTPLNPTGQAKKAEAVLRPSPKGFNLGYASSLGSKIEESMRVNPKNVGKITFGSVASPIQPKSYLQYEYIFIPIELWERLKAEKAI